MNHDELLTEGLAVLFHYPSAAVTAGAKDIGPFQLNNVRQALFVINVGAVAATATIDFKIQYGTTNTPTTDLPDSAITRITATPGTAGVVLVLLKVETIMNLNLGPGTRGAATAAPWVKGVLTVGNATTPAGVVVLGTTGYSPGADFNLAGAVLQTLVV